MLPERDTIELFRHMRERNIMTPTLLLSALDQVTDRIAGLRAGGNDYLVNKFALGELLARPEVLLRRPLGNVRSRLHAGPLNSTSLPGAPAGAEPLSFYPGSSSCSSI